MSFPSPTSSSPVPTSQEVNFLDKPLFCKGQEDWGISGIRSLAIVNCGLSPSIYPQLAAVLRASPGLEELNLARNGIGLEVERLISLILGLGLKKLSLASTGLNTKGAIALVPSLAALTLLDLSNNGLEDEFIETWFQPMEFTKKKSAHRIIHGVLSASYLRQLDQIERLSRTYLWGA